MEESRRLFRALRRALASSAAATADVIGALELARCESCGAPLMSPRKRRARRQGCSLEPTSDGRRLRFRFRLVMDDGTVKRFSEDTGLENTAANRKILAPRAALIGAEIRAGTFRLEEWFQRHTKADTPVQRDGLEVQPAPPPETIRSWYWKWIARKESNGRATPPRVRYSLLRAYYGHAKNHILPALGDLTFDAVDRAALETFRDRLRKKRLKDKTIRNVLDGTLRAMVRDAARAGETAANVEAFAEIEWEDYDPPAPTPFTALERERLLEHFGRKRWQYPNRPGDLRAHHDYFAYLFTLFYTGLRPSEAAAIRLDGVHLDGPVGALEIRASRTRRHEGRTKTRSAMRTVRLTPRNVKVLRPLIRLRARPTDYLFTAIAGGPVNQENFYELFLRAERALGITPVRDLYSTKDTFVTEALRARANPAWLEEQTGVSYETLKKHYRRFLLDEEWDRLELQKIDPTTTAPRERIGPRRAPRQTRRKKATGN